MRACPGEGREGGDRLLHTVHLVRGIVMGTLNLSGKATTRGVKFFHNVKASQSGEPLTDNQVNLACYLGSDGLKLQIFYAHSNGMFAIISKNVEGTWRDVTCQVGFDGVQKDPTVCWGTLTVGGKAHRFHYQVESQLYQDYDGTERDAHFGGFTSMPTLAEVEPLLQTREERSARKSYRNPPQPGQGLTGALEKKGVTLPVEELAPVASDDNIPF